MITNGLGNIATATAAMAFDFPFANASAEYNGIDDLYHRNGHTSTLTAGTGFCAKIGCIGIALENVDIALTSVEDDTLFKDCHPFEILAPSTPYTRFKFELNIKSNVDRIKTAIELDGIDMDRRPADRGALDADATGALQNLIAEVGQKHPYVFKAVAVAAGIQNTVSLNADHFAPATG